eukprot:12762417-Alexandrium_andersonii.AAC.1
MADGWMQQRRAPTRPWPSPHQRTRLQRAWADKGNHEFASVPRGRPLLLCCLEPLPELALVFCWSQLRHLCSERASGA